MRQNILIIVFIVALAATAFVWFQFIGSSSPPLPTSGLTPKTEEIAQFERLKNLKPDTSILSDPLFQSLEQFTSSLSAVQVRSGRQNPFLPF